MTKRQITGVTIDVDDQGYMTDHAQWNREVAAALAADEGIQLTAEHWKVLEFIEMIHDAGGKLYACKATVDMFKLSKADFCPQIDKILTVGEFYEASAGAQIIFT